MALITDTSYVPSTRTRSLAGSCDVDVVRVQIRDPQPEARPSEELQRGPFGQHHRPRRECGRRWPLGQGNGWPRRREVCLFCLQKPLVRLPRSDALSPLPLLADGQSSRRPTRRPSTPLLPRQEVPLCIINVQTSNGRSLLANLALLPVPTPLQSPTEKVPNCSTRRL